MSRRPLPRRRTARRLAPAAAAVAALLVVAAAALAPARALAQLAPGSYAVVSADGDCLRLRVSAGLTEPVLTCVPDGSIVTVLDGNRSVDGLSWQYVSEGRLNGWVAEQYLRPLAGVPPAPAITPVPAAPVAAPTISGELPPGGGLALVAWGGGAAEELRPAAAARGCALLSAWAVRPSRGLVGYIAGAPARVNSGWSALFPGALPPQTLLVLVCAAGATAAPTPAPAAPLQARVAALPPGIPALPPGPAANQ